MNQNISKEQGKLLRGQVVEISCNLDDMTGEEIGFALELLIQEGALDAYTVPIGMKKSRPGSMIVCICKEPDEEKMAHLLLKHTTTLGVRVQTLRRYTLQRRLTEVETPFGTVRVKESFGEDILKWKAEYDDLKEIAKKYNISLKDVRNLVEECYGGYPSENHTV